MLKKVVSHQFKTDIKSYKTNSRIISELDTVLKILSCWDTLPLKYKNHELKWEFKWIFECHILPDVLLFYEIDKQENIIQGIITFQSFWFSKKGKNAKSIK